MPVFAGFSKELAGKRQISAKNFALGYDMALVMVTRRIRAAYRLLDMSWNAEGAGPSQSAVLALKLEPIEHVSNLPVP
ncbi:hypothetical protein EGT51_09460 [Levilactobacillus suantsaiihabitans]|jgi:hypothetical protein|uniref:Uncharacterized protein n=1 Tax=Levilactobacillus suantsaiihabitans TaxID=2487722 RepID=A0A4Z0J882_9LACO|nr:hypothetical protein EGT51_09460 [Levilactobacillus suantsaiihabitans]